MSIPLVWIQIILAFFCDAKFLDLATLSSRPEEESYPVCIACCCCCCCNRQAKAFKYIFCCWSKKEKKDLRVG